MATRITATLDGIDQVKRGIRDTADSVRPLTAAMKAASDESRNFKDIAAAAVETTAQEYRKLALQVEGVKWNQFVAEMTTAAKTEQALSGETRLLSNNFRELTSSKGAASAAASQLAAAGGNLNKTQDLVRQGTFALSDMLAGGSTGGLKGAALGASNNLAMMAMTLSGPVGVGLAVLASALPGIIGLVQSYTSGTDGAATGTDHYANALEHLNDQTERMQRVSKLSTSEASKELDAINQKLVNSKKVFDESMEAVRKKYPVGGFGPFGLLTNVGDRRAEQSDIESKYMKDREPLVERQAELIRQIAKAKETERKRLVETNLAYNENNSLWAKIGASARAAMAAAKGYTLAEQESAKAQREAAKSSYDPKQIASEQQKATLEIEQSVREINNLNLQLEKTKDAKSADAIAEQMQKLSDRIKQAKDDLAALNAQQPKADLFDKMNKDLQKANDKAAADEKAALDKKYREEEEAAKQHFLKMQAALKGEGNGGPDFGQEIFNNLDPDAVRSQIAKNRRDQVMANGGNEKQARAAGRKALADFDNGTMGQTAGGAAEIMQAQADLATEQLDAMRKGGQFSEEAVNALQANMNEVLQLADEQNQLRQQVQNMQKMFAAQMANQRRRGQGG